MEINANKIPPLVEEFQEPKVIPNTTELNKKSIA